MGLLTPQRREIYEEETSYKASISETFVQKMGATLNWVLANSSTQLGDIIHSGLTEAQFQALRGNNWVLMNGQSIVGSDFAILTGITTLPDATTGGAFIGQQTGTLLDYEDSENKSHSHIMFKSTSSRADLTTSTQTVANNALGTYDYFMVADATSREPDLGRSGLTGETAAQPNTVRANIFIKINTDPT